MTSTQSTVKLGFLRHIYTTLSREYLAFKQLHDRTLGKVVEEASLHSGADCAEKSDLFIDFPQAWKAMNFFF